MIYFEPILASYLSKCFDIAFSMLYRSSLFCKDSNFFVIFLISCFNRKVLSLFISAQKYFPLLRRSVKFHVKYHKNLECDNIEYSYFHVVLSYPHFGIPWIQKSEKLSNQKLPDHRYFNVLSISYEIFPSL